MLRLPGATALALAVTVALTVGHARWAHETGIFLLVVLGGPVAFRTIRGMLRGHFAADIVAAFAIVGAIALQQPIAGLVIVLMQTGGELLERYAEGRASAAVRELEARAPAQAHRVRGDAVLDVAADEVEVDDELLVRPGEMIPCDGVVTIGASHPPAMPTVRSIPSAMQARSISTASQPSSFCCSSGGSFSSGRSARLSTRPS